MRLHHDWPKLQRRRLSINAEQLYLNPSLFTVVEFQRRVFEMTGLPGHYSHQQHVHDETGVF